MPIDRSNQNTPRPLKPSLASNRTAKTPLTPRLAAAPAAAPASSTQSTRTPRLSNGSTPKPPAATPDATTPARAFLNSNVTPRSSSRKSRVGVDSISPSSTPNATPTNSRPPSTIDFHKEQGPGYNGHGFVAQGGLRPRAAASAVSQTTPTPRVPQSGAYRPAASEAGGAKNVTSLFFHADDVKPQDQPQPAPLKKAPAFFHANGKQDDSGRFRNGTSPPLSSLGKAQSESKFFHADSLSEPRDRPPTISSHTVSASPELLPPHAAPLGNMLRPGSPTKEWSHLSYRKGASQVMRPSLNSRNSALSMIAGQNSPDVPESARRKSSASQSVVRFGHAKSASLSSIDSVTEAKRGPTVEHPTMTPSPLHTENRLVSDFSFRDGMVPGPSPPLAALSGLPSPVPSSPTGASGTKSALETMNELAANARRERKVLDLEISNSSLLAINRSLEKEVRKQKAELRRFRRLSRAGRFSTDEGNSPPESFSSVRDGQMGNLSDMSEEEEEEQLVEEEEDPDDSESSVDEGTMSPTLQAERDEDHRLRDEKRLQLDLSKHRELLVDSQKMNQSLKRCLGWTEQLIKDGQKALEYKVHVSDVRLGGRVLVTDDDNDETTAEESRGLLSPWSPLHSAMDALDSPFFAEPSRLVDRDSGIDMDPLETNNHASDIPLPASPTTAPSKSPDKEFRPRVPGRWESFAASRPQSGILDDPPLLGSPFEEKLRDLHASIAALEAS
ncbi:hypothetical protein ACN47E_000209 [Coniothyrium glycines]